MSDLDKLYKERALLQRVKEGDDDALQEIFKEFYPKLSFFAASIIEDNEGSRDLAQDALLYLWVNRNSLRLNDKKELSAYLFTIVRRDCYDILRHRKVQKDKASEIADRTALEDDVCETAIIHSEVIARLYNEIKKLPSPHSEILYRSFIEDLDTQEIADTLGLTVNHVRVLKSRALEKLRKSLPANDFLYFLLFILTTL